MALTAHSLFLYGLQVTENNRSIDFKSTSGGAERRATLTLGFYSLTQLMLEIKRAMEEVDPLRVYTVTANRSIAGGTQNRVTILTNGTYLDLLFGTGSRAASTVATLIGFNVTDYTSATTYSGSSSAGTVLITTNYTSNVTIPGYSWIPPTLYRQNFGALNVTASGLKEALVYSTQQFFQVQFKYIPYVKAVNEWSPLMTWMISQKGVDFTPEISAPTVFYDCTLESTAADGKGLAFKFTEMLPSHPGLYDAGLMKFRVRNS